MLQASGRFSFLRRPEHPDWKAVHEGEAYAVSIMPTIAGRYHHFTQRRHFPFTAKVMARSQRAFRTLSGVQR